MKVWREFWARVSGMLNGMRRGGMAGATANARTGAVGEAAAEAYLRTAGYRVLARNWRAPGDRRQEIDLVCEEGGALVFVEVKTRAAEALVSGAHAVDRRKRRALRVACEAYLRGLRPAPRTWRCDVAEVEIWGDGRAPVVRVYENAEIFRDMRAHRHR